MQSAARPSVAAILRLDVPPEPRYGKYVRERLLAFARTFPFSADDMRELIVAVGEALANAIEHAQSNDAIEISAWVIDGEKLIAVVADTGVGFAVDAEAATELPPSDAERGRGLPIMRRCTDLFAIRSAPGRGTAVVLGRYLRRDDRGGSCAAAG